MLCGLEIPVQDVQGVMEIIILRIKFLENTLNNSHMDFEKGSDVVFIFFISGEVLFFLLLLIIAGASWIIENIGWILLIAVVVNVVIPLLIYWKPKLFFAVVAAFLVIGLAVLLIDTVSENVKTNNQEYTLYRATDTCTFLDESHKTVEIPEGAIFVIFSHAEQKSKEPQFIGNSRLCYWYYGGTVHSSTVSVLAEIYKWDAVDWNREEIGTTTYREIMNGKWWLN